MKTHLYNVTTHQLLLNMQWCISRIYTKSMFKFLKIILHGNGSKCIHNYFS